MNFSMRKILTIFFQIPIDDEDDNQAVINLLDIESEGLCKNENILHPIEVIDCDGDGNVFVEVDQKEFLEVVNRAGAWFIRVTDSSKISSGAPLEFTISKLF